MKYQALGNKEPKEYKALGKCIVLKFWSKKFEGGIVLPTDNVNGSPTFKDEQKFEDVAEVFAVGDEVTKFKKKDKVYYVQRHYVIVPIERLLNIKKEEGVIYVKAKEEDIMAIIT